MPHDLNRWEPRSLPQRTPLEGHYVRLEPLDPARHCEGLHAASAAPQAAERFRWLFEQPPAGRADFDAWVARVAAQSDPFFFAVIDKQSGRIAGRQALMRIDAIHGVIEIGNILWTDLIARKPAATEALYLFARYIFDDLGYRRFEWKCNNDNAPSKAAALRFGFTFEGIFRQHMIVKGKNRDTAWFAMLDGEWPQIKAAFERWLAPDNFDSEGRQRERLADIRAGIMGG